MGQKHSKKSNELEGQGQDNGNIENMFPEDLRLVLIGKTGSGKSASGNTILGRKAFDSRLNASSVTKNCQLETADPCEKYNGHRVMVIDTPGVGETHLSEEEVHVEIAKCVALFAPGPHAFLLVLPLGRYTEDEVRDVDQLTKNFIADAISQHTLVLFTRGDDLEGTIEDFLKKSPPGLQALIERCGGRYHVFNNKDASDPVQVNKLISKVEKMAKQTATGFYTSGLYEEAEAVIREAYERLLGNQEQPGVEDQGVSSSGNREVSSSREEQVQSGGGKVPKSRSDWKSRLKAENMFPENLRMVLIGKTGSGKSASGNTILGRKVFESHLSGSSITKTCQMETADPAREYNGRRVMVIDTPGVGDTHLSEEEVLAEITKCVALTAPGPHAFLLVVSLMGRYTEDEDRYVNQLTHMFKEDAVCQHTLVLFTKGDDLEGTVEDFIKKSPPKLQTLIERCGGRYHVFNNKDTSDSVQVNELIRKVENMANQTATAYYTSELYERVQAVIREKYVRLVGNQGQPAVEDQDDSSREEQVQPGSSKGPNSGSDWKSWLKAALSPEVLQKIKTMVAAIAAGAAVGSLAGLAVPLAAACGASLVGTSVCFGVGLLVGEAAAAAAGTAVATVVTAATGASALKVGAATGTLVGGAIGAVAAIEEDSPSEAAKDAVKEVVQVGGAAVGVAAVAGGVLGAMAAIPAASSVAAAGAASGSALSGDTAMMLSAVDAPVISCAENMLTDIGTTAPALRGLAAVLPSAADVATATSDATFMMAGMGVAAGAAGVVAHSGELSFKLQTEKSTSGEGPAATFTEKKMIDFSLKKKNTGSDQ